MGRSLKPRHETNLVFIHIKKEQYVNDYLNSDHFTIHFCRQGFQTYKFSTTKNKKAYTKNIFSVIDI